MFKVSGTHSIFLTGNYVETAAEGSDMYDPDSDDEELDYDLEPDEDELDDSLEDDESIDELDDLEDPRIEEVDSEDEVEAPKLVEPKKAITFKFEKGPDCIQVFFFYRNRQRISTIVSGHGIWIGVMAE